MPDTPKISYVINDPIELNMSFIPFVKEGGLFVPTFESFSLGEKIFVDLKLPGVKDSLIIEGLVIWITPKNALHHVLPGIGIQFNGEKSKTIREKIEALLDPTMETGGYTYGIIEQDKKIKG